MFGKMRLRGLLWFNAIFSIMPVALLAGIVVEGRVELPKSHSAPVQAKRYEIVTKGGVLSTQPPLAVVYLDGAFPRPASLPTKEVMQKDLTFVPALPRVLRTNVKSKTAPEFKSSSFPLVLTFATRPPQQKANVRTGTLVAHALCGFAHCGWIGFNGATLNLKAC